MVTPHTLPRVDTLDVVQLRQQLAQSFSLSELQTACFDLAIEYQNLPGDTLEDKTRELIQYCRRHGTLLILVQYCQQIRPHIAWTKTVQPEPVTLSEVEQRTEHRRDIRKRQRNIHLVHTIQRSKIPGQKFDILVYLIHGHSDDLSDINYAEFFLGKYWAYKVFKIQNKEEFIGMAISAYGPVLCTCRVVFTDGYEAMLERYLDFEMSDHIKE